MSFTVQFKFFGSPVCIQTDSQQILKALDLAYQYHSVPESDCVAECRLTYRIEQSTTAPFVILPDQADPVYCRDPGECLFEFEQLMVVAVQHARPEQFFIHCAVLEYQGQFIALVASSGSGKSTTSWGLLHQGFSYLTDEMCAVDPHSLRIDCLTHALSLKQPPPRYELPSSTLHGSRSLLVPVADLPAVFRGRPGQLAKIFYIQYDAQGARAAAEPISVAESCARLYANGLNQLAHDNLGLDPAQRIAESVQSYRVVCTELEATSRLLRDLCA